MKNKTVLITGGGSGIGLGIARYLARLGANVIITDVSKDSIDNAIHALAKEGSKNLRV